MASDPITKLHTALQCGEYELKGQFILGSNYTFLVNVYYEGGVYPAVYKPSRGGSSRSGTSPRTPWPAGRWRPISSVRRWAFTSSRLPRCGPTVRTGPGRSSFIDYDPEYHYFNFSDADRQLLRPLALFDLLINNADRKGGHIFFEKNTHKLYAIDHGICFHEDDKLRTVLWDFGGQKIPAELLAHLSLSRKLLADLEPYLNTGEISALCTRAESLLKKGVFPRQPRDLRTQPSRPREFACSSTQAR